MKDLPSSGDGVRRRTDPEKVRRASLDPARPGLDVFEVRRIDAADFSQLSLIGKLKSRMHGMQSAYTPRADACQACGLCVVACPEEAIQLVPW
jgi:ferredoxin